MLIVELLGLTRAHFELHTAIQCVPQVIGAGADDVLPKPHAHGLNPARDFRHKGVKASLDGGTPIAARSVRANDKSGVPADRYGSTQKIAQGK
jgi:hypothetical protein